VAQRRRCQDQPLSKRVNMPGNDKLKPWHWFAVIAVAALLLQVATYYLVVCVFGMEAPSKAGEFGDLFGTVNALFSGLALAGVVVAILLQRQELEDQREVLKQQYQEFAEQTRLGTLRLFEDSYFSLLRFVREETHRVRAYIAGKDYVGLSAFRVVLQEVRSTGGEPGYGRVESDRLIEILARFAQFEQFFGGYLGGVRELVRFADRAPMDSERYVVIARSQLTPDELSLLFIYGLTKAGKRTLQPIIERRRLLSEWRSPDWLEAFRAQYLATAFIPDEVD
jgi:hypothetical protein